MLFDAAIEAAPESLEARYQRALAYLASDQPDAAISVLTQAIRLDPDVADYWYQRGLAQVALRDQLVASGYSCVGVFWL